MNKLNLLWMALMLAMGIADVVAHNWMWAAFMFAFASLTGWQMLPVSTRRRLIPRRRP